MKTALPSLLLGAVAVLSGCLSARYEFADPANVAPAQILDLHATAGPAEVDVDTVIYFKGPGSWKQEAYWDEYRLTLSNRSNKPLTVESAELVGLAPGHSSPGERPWDLEHYSRSLAEKSFGLAKDVSVQIGSGLGVTTLAAGVGAALGGSGLAAVGGAAAGAVIALPTVIGVSVYRNVHGRREIETEFQHRRLLLPVTLALGERVQRSLFFPITPGPRRLVIRGRSDHAPFETVIDLSPLKGLHLAAPVAATAAPPSATPPSTAPAP